MKTNLTKRFVGLLVSLSMMLAYAVPFAFAEGGIAEETLWTFESLFAGEKVTLSADTELDGLTIHATDVKYVEVDGSNKTIGEEKFSVRAKLIGKTDSTMGHRTLSFLPELDGTVTVYYAHASSSGDPRQLSVVQGDVRVDDMVEQGATKEFTTAVAGGTEVFIGSFEHNLNVYGVKYIPGAEAPEPDATDEPTNTEEPTETDEPTDTPATDFVAVTESTDWIFADYSDADVTTETLIAGGTMKIFGDEKMAIDGSNKTIDGVSYSMRLKMGGSAVVGEDGIPKTKAISIIPGVEGTVKVAFAHASGSGTTRTLLITQGGEQIGTIGVEPGFTEFIKVAVKANEPVYIYSIEGLNFYGVHFVAGGTIEATEAPANTEAPATEVPATEVPATEVPGETPEPGETTATPKPTATPTPKPTATPKPTEEPAEELVAVTESASWVFSDYASVNVTKDVLIADGTMKIFGDSKMTIDGSNKTIDDVKYSMRLKTGGAATFGSGGVPKTRAMSILPGVNGLLRVAFAHASGSGNPARTLYVAQDGMEIAELAVEGGATDVLEVEVEAGYPVYIYARDGVNYYAVYFEVGEPVDPNATPDPEAGLKDLREAQADADALTLRSISDYAVYIDLELVKKGEINRSEITWESSNEDYISIQDISSGGNYTGVVTRPTSDDEIDENGGVPVTLTATVTNGDAVVTREFDVSVRKFNPLYFNNFQADLGVPADEENGYLGIQDNVVAANGETFKGIRVSALKNAKSIIDYGFEHNDYDIEKNFDKRIMETSKYGQAEDPYGRLVDENYAFYYSEWKAYGGGTTQMPIWIKLADETTTSGYPEGIVIMSMDINIVTNGGQFSMGIGTSKPAQMCRFMLNKGGLRYFNEGDTVNYKEDEYDIPMKKWMTVTIVANTSTHLWDLYFDGILVDRNVRFRNAQDFAPTIEFTISRDSSKDAVLIDNIWVESITEDYNVTYWDDLKLDIPYDEEKDEYTASEPFLLYYNGLDGLAGNTYAWKSHNENLLTVGSESFAVEDLTQFGYTAEKIAEYKSQGVDYVTLAVARPVANNIPEEGTYVTITGSMEVGENIYKKDFKIFLSKTGTAEAETDSEKALADIAAIDSIKDGTTYKQAGNIDFEEIGAKYGSEFTWKSSNTSIISNTGKITRPQKTTAVTITVTAEYGEAKETEKFTVYVTGTGGGSGGGGGGGGGGGSTGGGFNGNRVMGTVTSPADVYETQAYTPEQTSQMIFNDIEDITWAKEAIEALYHEGIVSGYGNDLFAPNYSVTREQFVKMIVEALDLTSDADTELEFTDVAADAWYAPYIKVAVALGVVTGKDDGTFGVGESITRQDMAVMCVRALNAAGIELSGAADLADSATISDYAKDAVSKMVAAGYITGDENGNFNPLDTATRAQTAVVLYRIIK